MSDWDVCSCKRDIIIVGSVLSGILLLAFTVIAFLLFRKVKDNKDRYHSEAFDQRIDSQRSPQHRNVEVTTLLSRNKVTQKKPQGTIHCISTSDDSKRRFEDFFARYMKKDGNITWHEKETFLKDNFRKGLLVIKTNTGSRIPEMIEEFTNIDKVLMLVILIPPGQDVPNPNLQNTDTIKKHTTIIFNDNSAFCKIRNEAAKYDLQAFLK